MRWTRATTAVVTLAVILAGCGSTNRKSANALTATSVTSTPTTTTTSAAREPGALQAEADAASAGDIPDNQVFVLLRNSFAGYSMKYPEGWAQHGVGKTVVFRDKNNIVRVTVGRGPALTAATIRLGLRGLKGARVISAPRSVQLPEGHAYKVVYSTTSAPNAVTGKRVTLVVDRYYLTHGNDRAIVDLGTPVGVDNVDAYRMMVESFRWR